MTLRLVYQTATEELERAIREIERPVAEAGTAAIREAAGIAKAEARANIAAAGFGPKWQNALRANVYPPNGVSIRPAALIYHKIPYAGVFEEGATIRGKPMLWLPLPAVPVGPGGRRLTPSQAAKRFGPLVPVSRRGKRPLLIAKGAAASRLRVSAGARGLTRGVPLYVGVDVVTIRKRLKIVAIVKSAAAQLGALYLKHLRT